MFPMHLFSLPDGCLDELISVFIHGKADHLTSQTSTFPFSKDASTVFLDLLITCRALPPNPYIFTFVARVWSSIACSRHISHFGEEHARLDRTTSILFPRNTESTRLQNALSVALFRMPDEICAQLDEQYVDEIVTKHHWLSFMGRMMDDWKQSMQWTFALLTSNLLLTATTRPTVLSHSSLLLCATGILVAALLRHRHEKVAQYDPGNAATFLEEHDVADTGFQSLATVYSIPRAFFIWALVLFATQSSCFLLSSLPFPFGLLSGAIIAIVGLTVWKTLNPSHRLSRVLSFSHIPALFPDRPQKRAECDV